MTSYVFSVIDKKIIWSKVYDILKSKYDEDFEMVFAIKKSNTELADLEALSKQHENISVLTFDDNKSENEMLNDTIKAVKGENMILCRDYFEYATVLSDYLLAMGELDCQVALFRRSEKKGKIRQFFSSLYHNTVAWLFGFKLYEGDIGLMYFGNIALSIMREMPNSSYYTKVNKWSGFDISYVESDELLKPKIECKERKRNIIAMSVTAGIIALLITLFVILCVVKTITFIVGLLIIFSIFAALFYLFYLVLKFTILKNYGDLS